MSNQILKLSFYSIQDKFIMLESHFFLILFENELCQRRASAAPTGRQNIAFQDNTSSKQANQSASELVMFSQMIQQLVSIYPLKKICECL